MVTFAYILQKTYQYFFIGLNRTVSYDNPIAI